ncbi:MAG: hypothetical protein AAFW84_34270, partial [Cyanobacteria bacterium J06635_15]
GNRRQGLKHQVTRIMAESGVCPIELCAIGLRGGRWAYSINQLIRRSIMGCPVSSSRRAKPPMLPALI